MEWSAELVTKLAIFGLYFIFAIITLVFVFLPKHPDSTQCRIKYTYQQKPMGDFLADPFYSSTGIMRGSPPPLHAVLKGEARPYSQLLSDVAAFPVAVADPVSNSPFLPIQFRSFHKQWTLTQFMDTVVGRNLTQIFEEVKANTTGYADPDHIYNNLVRYLDHNQDMYPLADDDMRAVLGILRTALVASSSSLSVGSETLLDSIVAYFLTASSDITFFIEDNGDITFPSSYGSPKADPHNLDDNRLMLIKAALLGKGLMGTSRGNSMVPNYGRCLKEKITKETLKTGSSLLHELVNMVIYSHRRGTCLSTGQPLIVDVTSNPKTSLILFSSNDVAFLVLLVTAITASFYLSSLITMVKRESLINFLTAVLIIWHVGLLVTCGVCLYNMHIPTNNIMFGAGLCVAALCYQLGFTLHPALPKNLKENIANIPYKIKSMAQSKTEYSTPPLMRLTIHGQDDMSSFGGQPRHRGTAHMGLHHDEVQMGKKMIIRAKLNAATTNEESTEDHEYVGMALTWPLLFVAAASSASPYVSTYSVQQIYAVALVFYLVRLAYPKMPSSYDHGREVKVVSWLILILTGAMLLASIIISFVVSWETDNYNYKPDVPVSPQAPFSLPSPPPSLSVSVNRSGDGLYPFCVTQSYPPSLFLTGHLNICNSNHGIDGCCGLDQGLLR